MKQSLETEMTESRDRDRKRTWFSLSLSNISVSGFGLLEVLLSAGILALIIGAIVALSTNAVRTSTLSADRTTAYQLAQEGVELVRQMRDSIYIDGAANNWNSKFPSECVGSETSGANCQLKLVGDNWTLESGQESIKYLTGDSKTDFTRAIRLQPIDWYKQATVGVPNDDPTNPLAFQIISIVSWPFSNRTISVTASTFLTDWRPVQ